MSDKQQPKQKPQPQPQPRQSPPSNPERFTRQTPTPQKGAPRPPKK